MSLNYSSPSRWYGGQEKKKRSKRKAKKPERNFLKVGDVFTSRRLEWMKREGGCLYPLYEGQTSEPVTYCETVTAKDADGNEYEVMKEDERDDARHSPARGKARFVVLRVDMCGGGYAHGPGDYFSDGLHVTARKLKKDGSFNPRGEKVRFYMSGDFIGMIEPEEVEIVGRMKMNFKPDTTQGTPA